jgi:hypothetical protein
MSKLDGDPDPRLSALVAALEHAWVAIQAKHHDVPAAVVVAGNLRGAYLGHFVKSRWSVAGNPGTSEVALSTDALALSAEELFHVLLHEAVHGVCATRGLRETSRDGRYHNSVFAAVATELGLSPERVEPHGFQTQLTVRARLDFSTAIAAVGAAQKLRPSTDQRYRPVFFTVGYGAHTPTSFIELLVGHGVRTVADIRI